jgi:large subunit ribosomal protein L4
MKAAVKTLENKDAGSIDLDDSIFGVEVKKDVLHRAVHWQLNKRRAGTHKTKDVSEVAGTGKKPHSQKGTGHARAGQRRRPQTVGGGRVFGPVVRSHETDLPKKIRKLALKMALSSKAAEKKLIVIDEAVVKSHKTKPVAAALKKFGFESALIVGGKEIDANFARATANLPKIDVLPSVGANVYDIIRRDVLVLTKDAVSELTEKLKG